MQDVQNIPNPDVNSNETNDDFGSHPNLNQDVERPEEDIPVPPDQKPNVPVEEPPEERDKPPVEEDETNPRQLL